MSTTTLDIGRPSNRPSQHPISTGSDGFVSRPCHQFATLKYSFKARVRYGPTAGRTIVGGFRLVTQPQDGNPSPVSDSSDGRRSSRQEHHEPRKGGQFLGTAGHRGDWMQSVRANSFTHDRASEAVDPLEGFCTVDQGGRA
jgi:hypothetical protein